MPRPRSLKPKYCLDKPSGRAFVTLAGKRLYLGQHRAQQCRDKYDRVVGEWITQGRPRAIIDTSAGGPTVTQIIVAFWAAARKASQISADIDCDFTAHFVGDHIAWDR